VSLNPNALVSLSLNDTTDSGSKCCRWESDKHCVHIGSPLLAWHLTVPLSFRADCLAWSKIHPPALPASILLTSPLTRKPQGSLATKLLARPEHRRVALEEKAGGGGSSARQEPEHQGGREEGERWEGMEGKRDVEELEAARAVVQLQSRRGVRGEGEQDGGAEDGSCVVPFYVFHSSRKRVRRLGKWPGTGGGSEGGGGRGNGASGDAQSKLRGGGAMGLEPRGFTDVGGGGRGNGGGGRGNGGGEEGGGGRGVGVGGCGGGGGRGGPVCNTLAQRAGAAKDLPGVMGDIHVERRRVQRAIRAERRRVQGANTLACGEYTHTQTRSRARARTHTHTHMRGGERERTFYCTRK